MATKPELYDLNFAGRGPLAWITSGLDAIAACAPEIAGLGALRAWSSGDCLSVAARRLDDRRRGDRSCDALVERRHGPHQKPRQGGLA